MSSKLNLKKSEKLYKDALDLIPGAILGIRRPYNFVVGEYPIFLKKAYGGRVEDVDGNTYIDMLCAYGPIILGHREREIDEAVIHQMQDGFCMSLTQEIQNRLAKKLKEIIPSCEKSIFLKTGSDATTTAIRIARGFNEKDKIIRCGYHGWHDWCVEVKGGIPKKLYEDTLEFRYNDPDGLEQLLKENKDNVSAIIITPVGHPLAQKVEMPNPGFLEKVRELATHYKTVLIFDEIRSGFRVNLGGAQKEFGVTPDLSVFGKAMGNGYPISAVVGKAEIMDVAIDKIFISSTFFPNSLEQAAALKTIEILQRDNVLQEIKEKGLNFESTINKILQDSPVNAEFSGSPWMPFITFPKDDKKLYKKIRTCFYTEVIRGGVFLQPYHHGYIAYRHSNHDLDIAANAISNAMDACSKLL